MFRDARGQLRQSRCFVASRRRLGLVLSMSLERPLSAPCARLERLREVERAWRETMANHFDAWRRPMMARERDSIGPRGLRPRLAIERVPQVLRRPNTSQIPA